MIFKFVFIVPYSKTYAPSSIYFNIFHYIFVFSTDAFNRKDIILFIHVQERACLSFYWNLIVNRCTVPLCTFKINRYRKNSICILSKHNELIFLLYSLNLLISSLVDEMPIFTFPFGYPIASFSSFCWNFLRNLNKFIYAKLLKIFRIPFVYLRINSV